jgi:tetratricopeptide (TPR) repeat protein
MNFYSNEIEKLKSEGNKKFSEGDFERAIENFKKALDLIQAQISYEADEENIKKIISVLYSNKSNCLIKLKKYDEARRDAQVCIENNPDWYKGYLRLGTVLFKLNLINQSRENFEFALERSKTPEDKEEIKNLIIFLFDAPSSKKSMFLNSIKDSFAENEEKFMEKVVQDQYDWLMTQFIKPYEEDAFRCLSAFHGVNECELSKESALSWIKFGEKYGTGDTPEILISLKKFVTLEEDSQDLEDEFNKIYDLSKII